MPFSLQMIILWMATLHIWNSHLANKLLQPGT